MYFHVSSVARMVAAACSGPSLTEAGLDGRLTGCRSEAGPRVHRRRRIQADSSLKSRFAALQALTVPLKSKKSHAIALAKFIKFMMKLTRRITFAAVSAALMGGLLAAASTAQVAAPPPRPRPAPQTNITVDGSEAMFTTMCAL